MTDHDLRLCMKCQERKPLDAMQFRNGAAIKVCRDCYREQMSGASRKRAGDAVPKAKPRARPAAKAKTNGAHPPVETPVLPPNLFVVRAMTDAGSPAPLKIAPGYGVDAEIEDDCLALSQGDDAITLTRFEARTLFERFESWLTQ